MNLKRTDPLPSLDPPMIPSLEILYIFLGDADTVAYGGVCDFAGAYEVIYVPWAYLEDLGHVSHSEIFSVH